ncbi:MipA/OmpV family protein [Neiella marina]|nr:MipA/OmpV family protein [Neiella marina]
MRYLLACLLLVSGLVLAEQNSPETDFHWQIDIGAVLSYEQGLVKSIEEYDQQLTIHGVISGGLYYKRFFIETNPVNRRSTTIGYTLHEDDKNVVNLVAESLFERISEGAQERGNLLDGIDKRRNSMEVGFEYYRTIGRAELKLSLLHDALSNHDGLYGSIDWGIPIYRAGYLFAPSLFVEFLDSNITDYYFGVDSHEASAQLPEYRASSAWRGGIQLYAERPINEQWSAISFARYAKVSNEISDSPIVAGRDETYSIHAGVLWSF